MSLLKISVQIVQTENWSKILRAWVLRKVWCYKRFAGIEIIFEELTVWMGLKWWCLDCDDIYKNLQYDFRGNSKYHYYGIRIKANSPLNQFTDDQTMPMRQQPLYQGKK